MPGDWFQFIVPCQEPYFWLCYFSIPGSFRVENFGKYFLGGLIQVGVPGGYQNNLKIHSPSASRPRGIIPINWNPEHLPPLGLQSHNNGDGGLILPGILRLSYTVLCALREPATKFSATIFRSLVLYQRSLAPPWQESCTFGLKENLHFCIKQLFWASYFQNSSVGGSVPAFPLLAVFEICRWLFHLYVLLSRIRSP